MTLRRLITIAFISSSFLLLGCSNIGDEIDAPNATTKVAMEVFAVPVDATGKPAFSVNMSLIVTATVIAIDHEERLVTLKDEDGNPLEIKASEDAKNLDQVNIGDIVTAEFMKHFALRVLEAKSLEAGASEVALLASADEGQKPAMAAIGETVSILLIEEINLEAGTFKLKNKEGVIQEFVSIQPENLKKVVEGDVLLAVYTEGVAISIAEPVSE